MGNLAVNLIVASSLENFDYWFQYSCSLILQVLLVQFANRILGEDKVEKAEGMFGRSRKEIMHHQIVAWQWLCFHKKGKSTSPH